MGNFVYLEGELRLKVIKTMTKNSLFKLEVDQFAAWIAWQLRNARSIIR